MLLFAASAQAQLSPVAEALRLRVDEVRYVTEPQADAAERTGVAAFYEAREFRPAWDDAGRRAALTVAIESLRDDGLDPSEYPLVPQPPVTTSSTDLPGLAQPPPRDVLAEAADDWATTASLMRALRHLSAGKVDPRKADPEWEIVPSDTDVQALAVAASSAVDAGHLAELFDTVRPAHPLYRQLRAGLVALRALEAAGGWPSMGEGPTIEPGSTDPRIPRLRERLYLGGYLARADVPKDQDNVTVTVPAQLSAHPADLGDLPPEQAPAPLTVTSEAEVAVDVPVGQRDELYDDELVAAVRHFQAEQYLDADGRIGKGTLAALDAPVAARIEQVRVNLERMRWNLDVLDSDELLLVDIAGYRATLFKGAQAQWSTRVQVGMSYRRTPILESRVTYLTFNPTWTVPPTILRKDVLPKVRSDLGYLDSHNLRVLDTSGQPVDPASVDWSRPGAVILRQDPGPTNALGRVVIRFPNSHMVYLHDTPRRSLFDRNQRAFSSGCIRTENALDLARLLLDDPAWSAERIDEVLAEGRTTTVPIAHPIPIVLAYWTVDVQPDGRVTFKPDVYDRDALVARMLDRHAPH